MTTHGLKGANIPVSLYEFDFISPTWSPDLAGWSMLAAIVLAVLTVISSSSTIDIDETIKSLYKVKISWQQTVVS